MSTEIELPTYMNTLSQEIIDILTQVEELRVIACGVDPQDNSLIYLTNNREIRSISPNGDLIPKDASPSVDGKSILIRFHGILGQFLIAILLAHDVSVQLLSNASLSVGDKRICDIEF